MSPPGHRVSEAFGNIVFPVSMASDPWAFECLVDVDLWSAAGLGVAVEFQSPVRALRRVAPCVHVYDSRSQGARSCRHCVLPGQPLKHFTTDTRPSAKPSPWRADQNTWRLCYWRRRLQELDAVLLVVAGEVLSQNRAAVLAARHLGIPSVQLQHGYPVGWWGYAPSVATKVFSWGPVSTARLASFGIDPQRIVEVGNARVDALCTAANTERANVGAFRARVGLPESAYVICLCEGYLAMPDRAVHVVVSTLAAVLAQRRDVHVLVKTHPAESVEDVTQVLCELLEAGAGRVVVRAMELDEALAMSDLVLVMTSSVGIDAAGAGFTVAALADGSQAVFGDDVVSGIPAVADSRELLRFMDNPQRVSRNTIQAHLGANLGRGRERFFEEAVALVPQGARQSRDAQVDQLFAALPSTECTRQRRLRARWRWLRAALKARGRRRVNRLRERLRNGEAGQY